jgi:alcohol dehydrogenase
MKGRGMRRQSLLLVAPRQLEWVTEELPPLRPNEVLVQTTAGAISIGSELPRYCGTARSTQPASYPQMTGYESTGTIVACGSAVQRLRIGERVVAFYGHRTHAIVPEAKAIAVPAGISDALALLAILTCDVSKGIRKVSIKTGELVLLTGAGAIGLLTIFILKAMGIEAIDIVEPRAERQTLAVRIGARKAISLQEIESMNSLYDTGFECSSRNAAFELLQSSMRHEGCICILADGNLEPLVLAPAFHEKELRIVGSSDGRDYQEHARWYFDVVRGYAYNLEQIFNYYTKADDLAATFERLATGAITPTKVLVQYERNEHPTN